MALQAGWNGFAGRIWPAGRSFETPALDHSFWTWNPSKSSKLSKDSDCSLVSYKNFSEILPSNAGMTNLFAIAGHFVSYRWVSGPHNFLVILWYLFKNEKIVHQQKQTTNESNKKFKTAGLAWMLRRPH